MARSSGRLGLAALLMLLPACMAQAADDLEKKLLQEIPQVMRILRDKGYQNVGVLKFRVKKGNQAVSDQVGTLNQRLAEKLELALVVGNDIRNPIGVVRGAGQVAAGIDGANHLSPEGRQKFFTAQYPLAWGEEKVVPDAFLTGVALISQDLRQMTVGILAFDRESQSLEPLAKFKMQPDLEDLLESGESFTVRGVFDQASLSLTSQERKDRATEEAIQTSLRVKSETANNTAPTQAKIHPLSGSNPQSPIELEIKYDNVVQPIEFREGAAFVPEPQEGQKVFLIVKRRPSATQRLGLVLKVNGESTLQRQTLPDAQCQVWVLEPDQNIWGFQGYYFPDKDALEPFRVMSASESKSKEIDYGEFVGTISVSVFPERKVAPKISADLLTDEAEDLQILAEGKFPDDNPKNLAALRQQLTSEATRGLISHSQAVQLNIDTTKFVRDSIPVMTATIKYYNPHDLPQ